MNNKILGVVLIVVGVALGLWGFNIYNSAGAELSRALVGSVPDNAWIGLVGGAVCIVIGILKVK
jgi:Protein of unknown function (DUF3185)